MQKQTKLEKVTINKYEFIILAYKMTNKSNINTK